MYNGHDHPLDDAVIRQQKAPILQAILDEYKQARKTHGEFASPHEAYAVILEELDEFWDEVKKFKPGDSKVDMRNELIQVASTALAAIMEVT